MSAGRKRKPGPLGAVTAELTEDDLKQLNLPRPIGIEDAPTPLAKIRFTHHSMARLLAAGKTPTEVSFLTGYSLSRISTLQSDPGFKELLAHYTAHKDEVFADVLQYIGGLTLDALQELHGRILEAPDSVSTRELLDLVNSNLDRLGHAPVQRHQHVVAIADLDRLKAAADAAHAGTVHVLNRTPSAPAEGGPLGLNRAMQLTVAEGQIVREQSEGADLPEEGDEVLPLDLPTAGS